MRVAAVICALLTGCSPSPAEVAVEPLDVRPQVIPAQQVHADARGPVVQFAEGAADGVPFEMSLYDTASERCVALVLAEAESAGCLPIAELPDDDVLTRLAGGGTEQSVNPEAGLAAPAVAAVWVELDDGRRVDGHVVDLRPAIDASAYFFFLVANADSRSIVAAADDGQVLKRIDLEDE